MVHIRTLRKKIEDDPNHPDMITTVRGRGYIFRGIVMYRKFTITFLKYMTLFLIVSIFLVILGLFIFGLNFASLFSTDNIKQLDTYELITEIDEENGNYKLSN